MEKIRIGVLARPVIPAPTSSALPARHPNIRDRCADGEHPRRQGDGGGVSAFFMLDLPKLVEWEKVDWSGLDVAFCGLPHGTDAEINRRGARRQSEGEGHRHSGDFRLRDMATYAEWYGTSTAPRRCRAKGLRPD